MQMFTQKNGYLLAEVVSALQKEIRRGKEREALFWALELCPNFEAYLWQRLVTIGVEDVGIANPEVFTAILALRQTFMEFREAGKNGSARLVLANAILLLCRSPKSRISDHLQTIVAHQRETGLHLDIPDYAIDKHTAKGRVVLKRGYDHWLTEGCKLDHPAEIDDPYSDEAAAIWKAGHREPDWPKRTASGKPKQMALIPELAEG